MAQKDLKTLRSQLHKTDDPQERVELTLQIGKLLRNTDRKKSLGMIREAQAIALESGNDYLRALCLDDLGSHYILSSDYHKAIEVCTEAHDIFRRYGNAKKRMSALLHIGQAKRHLYQFEEAIASFTKASEIARQHNLEFERARLLETLGITYSELGEYLKAIDYLFQSLKVMESLGHFLKTGHLHNNVGNIYGNLGEFENALFYFEKSLDIHSQNGDKFAQAVTLSNIGESHYLLNRLDEALKRLKESHELLNTLGDRAFKATVNLIIGQVYEKRREFGPAIEYLNDAISIAEKMGNKKTVAQGRLHLGNIFAQQNRFGQALVELEAALTVAREIKEKNLEFQTHEALSTTYQRLNRPWEALEHFQAYARCKDDVQSQETRKAIADMQARFNLARAENEKEIFRLKNVELTNALQKVELLNANLLSLNDEKNDLLGVLAHDLRTPLTGIVTSVSIIENYYARLSREEVFRHLARISATANRINTIITNLLDVNAIETGKLPLIFEELNLADVVKLVANDFENQAASKDIELLVDYNESGTILADHNALRNVLSNLVSNALKFSPRGRKVGIEVYRHETMIRCRVYDEGPGLKEEDKEKLFTKFARLSARPTAGEQSTGLGLSIVKKLVEATNGNVFCESEYGKGASFTVEYPEFSRHHN